MIRQMYLSVGRKVYMCVQVHTHGQKKMPDPLKVERKLKLKLRLAGRAEGAQRSHLSSLSLALSPSVSNLEAFCLAVFQYQFAYLT